MENYTRTAQDVVLSAQAPSSPNEVLCSAHGKVTAYVDVACAMLDRDGDNARVVIVGKGKGINKAVSTAEALKRKVSGLYQDTRIASEQVVDRWEPVAEKLDVYATTKEKKIINFLLLSVANVFLPQVSKSSGTRQ